MATIIGTRKMILIVNAVDHTADVSKCALVSGKTDSDFVSFVTALAGGGRDYTLKLTIRQDTDTDSLWYHAWNSVGSELAVILWPNGGGVTEGASTPKFVGTVVITEPDGDFIGAPADPSPTKVATIDVEWKYTAKPTIDITP